MSKEIEKHHSPELRFPDFNGYWEEKRLDEVAKIKGGKRIPKGYSLTNKNTGQRYITVSDFHNQSVSLESVKFVPLEVIDQIKSYRISTKDIYVSVAGTLGLVGIIPRELEGANLTENADKITNLNCDQKFLLQYLHTSRLEKLINSVRTIGAQPKLAIYALSSLKLYFPSTKEQTKIADFLAAVDGKLEALRRKRELLAEYKRGVMQKLFSQEIRFVGDDGRPFPDWEMKRLGNFLMQHKEKSDYSNQYPVLTSSRKGIFLQSEYYANREVASKDNTGYNVVPRGYFTYRHMSDDLIFRFNINSIVDYGIVSTLYPVFTTRQTDDCFLKHILNHGNDFKKYALIQKQGGSRTYMYFSKLAELRLGLPSLAEQQKIAKFLTAIDYKISAVEQQILQIDTFKKGLLQQMFV